MDSLETALKHYKHSEDSDSSGYEIPDSGLKSPDLKYERIDIPDSQIHNSQCITKYITLTGEMVGPHGDIHGGRIQDDNGKTIGRAERLKKLTAFLEEIDSEVQSLQEKRSELSVEIVSLHASIGESEKALEGVRSAFPTFPPPRREPVQKRMPCVKHLKALMRKLKK